MYVPLEGPAFATPTAAPSTTAGAIGTVPLAVTAWVTHRWARLVDMLVAELWLAGEREASSRLLKELRSEALTNPVTSAASGLRSVRVPDAVFDSCCLVLT